MHYEGPADDVGDLANAFDQMLDSLAASLDAQRRFAANASHELKTPIATIQTVADVALMQAGDSDPQLVDALRRIREVNARAGQTVQRLLAFARAEAAQPGSLTGQPVDMVALCTEICAQYGVPLRVSGAPAAAAGDEVLLRQAVSNLVANAVEHGVAGTAVVTVEGGAVVVENQGPTLDPGEVERLKEPFVRGAGRVAGSHGLGLSLADAIARAHGGNLHLAAREGGGLRADLALR